MGTEVRGVLGDVGSCKTLFVVANMVEAFIANPERCRIVGNLKSLRLPQMYMPFDEMAKTVRKYKKSEDIPPEFQYANIIWDELGKGADSYEFLASNPRSLSEIVFEIRKYDSIIWYTAQRRFTVTRRIRELTPLYFLMEPIDVTPEFYRVNPHLVNVHEISGRLTLKACANVTAVDDNDTVLNKAVFNGWPYVNYYNTRERIISTTYDSDSD